MHKTATAKTLSVHAASARDERRLNVTWSNGRSADFAAVWLLDNAPEHRDAGNGQRLVDVADLPEDPLIAAVEQDGRTITIRWAGQNRATTLSALWLRDHACDESAPPPPSRRPAVWSAADAAAHCWMDAAAVNDSDSARREWFTAVVERGIAFLHNGPVDEGFVLELAARIGYVRETNYGRTFDVQYTPDPNNLAYSDRGLGPHTDNPYREPVPGLQMLHCLRPSREGGESLFVDGFAAAAALQAEEPESFGRLTRIRARFLFRDRYAILSAERPLIQLDLSGEIEAIHYNNRSIAPLRLPVNQMAAFYRSYRSFSRRLRSPEFLYEVKLQPGDVALWDNRRVLHGRKAFARSSERLLRGCYIDRDGLLSNLALLQEKLK